MKRNNAEKVSAKTALRTFAVNVLQPNQMLTTASEAPFNKPIIAPAMCSATSM